MRVERRDYILIPVVTELERQVQQYIAEELHTVRGTLEQRFPARKILDMQFSNMPTGEEFRDPSFREDPIRSSWWIEKCDRIILRCQVNPRANYRWVSRGQEEDFLVQGMAFGVTVEPAWTHCSITLTTNVEMDPGKRPVSFTETFAWEDDRLIVSTIEAVNYEDRHLIEGLTNVVNR